eukprot:1144403-Pelagomonas_calceolata.AAC.2
MEFTCKLANLLVVETYFLIYGVFIITSPTNTQTHSVKYAHKLVTTRRAIENKKTPHSRVLDPGASCNPPDPH